METNKIQYRDINNIVQPKERMQFWKAEFTEPREFILKKDLDALVEAWCDKTIERNWFNWDGIVLKDTDGKKMVFSEEEKERLQTVTRILFVIFLQGVFKIDLDGKGVHKNGNK